MDIRIPLDRALDLLSVLERGTREHDYLRGSIIEEAKTAWGGPPPDMDKWPDPQPEDSGPWTPKVGERVVTRYGEVGVVEGVNTQCRVEGCCAVRDEAGRLLGHSIPVRPAEEAR